MELTATSWLMAFVEFVTDISGALAFEQFPIR